MKTKIITISLPEGMEREIHEIAQEEHRTISELIRESFRQYKAQRVLNKAARYGRKVAQEKGLTPEDFGGPFQE